MRILIDILLSAITLIFILLTAIFTRIWLGRLALPYNEEGRWYDRQDMLVYHEQAIIVYGILALICALASLLLCWLFWRRKLGRMK